MNGPDKHHMIVLEADDGGHVMCSGCRAQGEGFKYRPPGECPKPWLDREQLQQRNTDLAELLRKFFSFVQEAPVGSGVCCCGGDMSIEHHGDHTPVDQWDHSVSCWGREIEAALTQGVEP